MRRTKEFTPRSFVEAELEQHAGHVRYELEMLVHAAEFIDCAIASSPINAHQTQLNMALESFLLHFRNLTDFLCLGLASQDDDLFASDFLDRATPIAVVSRARLINREESIRLNKMLAHLSRQREKYVGDKLTWWETADMGSRAIGAFADFAKRLPSQRRAWFPTDEWIDEKSRILRKLVK